MANYICVLKLDWLIRSVKHYIEYLKKEYEICPPEKRLLDFNPKWGIAGIIRNYMTEGYVGIVKIRPGFDWQDIKNAFTKNHLEDYICAIDFAKWTMKGNMNANSI